jgi:hypothetical protein
MHRNTFQQGFMSFAHHPLAASRIPVLLLNSTHVQSGRRYLASTAAIQPTMHDVGDVLQTLRADMPLSTAIHNSARFAYVSPAGHMDRRDGVEYGHVVDGGYFENSALASLRDVYDLLAREHGLHPYVLYLCNDPRACRASAGDPGADDTFRSAAADELLSPFRALYRTRDARGSFARASLRAIAGDHFLQLDVCDETPPSSDESEKVEKARARVVSPPLGWLLSKLARDWMDASLGWKLPRPDGNCYERNAWVITELHRALAGSAARLPAAGASPQPAALRRP